MSTIKDLGKEFLLATGFLFLIAILPAIVIATVMGLLAPVPEPQEPVVTELSQTDQATCDELAGYYEQVTNGASLDEVQRTASALNAENTYPVKSAYEAYEDAEALHQDSLAGAATTDEADDAVKGARFAYVQACIL